MAFQGAVIEEFTQIRNMDKKNIIQVNLPIFVVYNQESQIISLK